MSVLADATEANACRKAEVGICTSLWPAFVSMSGGIRGVFLQKIKNSTNNGCKILRNAI